MTSIALRSSSATINHPGDGHPGGDNPICMTCCPPIMDRVRGRVVPAWGSGILYTDFVGNGGLNPVDYVTSGVYLYGIAAFARLVAEHRASQAGVRRPRNEIRQRSPGDHVGLPA